MDSTTRTGKSVNQLVATVFGAVYVLVGILGFFVDSDGFAAKTGGKLLGIFEVNPLHNLAHILIGVALLVAAKSLSSARAVNTTVGAAYLLLGIVGLFIADPDNSANILALNGADNALHFASAVVLLGTALAADKAATNRTTTTV
jgi:hypothetical protein